MDERWSHLVAHARGSVTTLNSISSRGAECLPVCWRAPARSCRCEPGWGTGFALGLQTSDPASPCLSADLPLNSARLSKLGASMLLRRMIDAVALCGRNKQARSWHDRHRRCARGAGYLGLRAKALERIVPHPARRGLSTAPDGRDGEQHARG
jgi:hypothetical protein